MIDTCEYSHRAIALESNNWNAVLSRVNNIKILRLLHACAGINTESGELTDILKKHLFYGREIDVTNLKEECGDLIWYINLILDSFGWTWEEVMETNISKLEFRYKDKKFAETQALNRDLEKERQILEAQ